MLDCFLALQLSASHWRLQEDSVTSQEICHKTPGKTLFFSMDKVSQNLYYYFKLLV